MRILSIIQPSEMGPDFRFEDDVWKVNFPAGSEGGGGVPLSTDANNAIGLGSDEGAFISTDLLSTYALTQDNYSKKINLWRIPYGETFEQEGATLVSSVNMVELSGIFDDVAIDGDLITFTDADTGLTLTIDTANLQKVSDINGSDSVNVMSEGGVTTLSVKVSPHPDNLIEVTEEGLFVDAANFGEGGGDLDLHQTLAEVENGLCHVVGNSHLVVPQIELVDVAGNPIGYINDLIGLPVSSTTEGPDHCPKWEAPTANNCRVGKVAVAFVPNLMYGVSPQDSSLEWRIFMNGEDTGYIAAVDMSHPPVVDQPNQPMMMSLTQNDFGDGDDFKGKGWLQDIISEATNGTVSGSYHNGATLLNETNQQVILTLVPNKPITLDEVRFVYNIEEGSNIYELTLDQITAIRNSPSMGPIDGPVAVMSSMSVSDGVVGTPPTVAVLEDYFDEETGVINICLAPNNSGNGGSTGPQISCAGATDRFATSGLWYRWTVKLNGKTLIENARSSDVIQALESKGIRVGYEGEMRTTYRNLTNENIRLEFIAGIPDNRWDQIYLELDNSTNPTLMGYDPLQNRAEARMLTLFPPEELQSPERYQRLTVCLAPADDWMDWDYKDIDTSTTVITLRNSVNLIGANQGFRVVGEHNLELETGVDVWGDLTWTIRANSPQRREVILSIDHPDHQDEFRIDFFARKPMVVTLANPHEYARETTIVSSLDAESIEILSVEVVGRTGSTVINNPEDAMVIDAVHGSVRFDDLENGKFSYIVQGRQFATGISDSIKVKFVTDSGAEEVVEHTFRADDIDGFLAISSNQLSTVTIGLVDNARYGDVKTLPTIRIVSPDLSEVYLNRTNMVGGEATMEFDFSRRSTYKLYIHAYLGTGAGKLAILGDSVIGVDDWGDVEAGGYTFNQETYAKRFGEDSDLDFLTTSKNNLSYVPKEGPTGMQDMTGMFAGTDLNDERVDLSGYDVGNVYSMAGVFAHSNFNGSLTGWNMRWVGVMDYAFYGSKYRQDLSLWCVPGISVEPYLFSHRAPLLAKHKPVWGTCPLEGNNKSSEWGSVELRNPSSTYTYNQYGLADDIISKTPGYTAEGKLISVDIRTPMRFLGKRSLKDQEITSLRMLDGMLVIDEQALMNNKLTTVNIPSTVKVIGKEAFAGNPMTSIVVASTTPPSLGAGALPETVTQIVMSDAMFAAYAKHADWKQYAGKFTSFKDAVGVIYSRINGTDHSEKFYAGEVIPASALQDQSLRIHAINEGVTTIGESALSGNVAGKLKIPASLTTVATNGLNLRADIVEFPEGFVSNEYLSTSRFNTSTLILPSTTEHLTGIMLHNKPSTICCKAVTPPPLEVSGNTHVFGSKYFIGGILMRGIGVPAESIDLYKADPNWNALTNNFIPLEEFEYGNVKTLERTWTMGSGNSLAMYGVITGTADLADVGKTVTILYSDFRYNSNLGYNERSNIEKLSAVVQPDGTFRLETGFYYRYATQFVTAYIGYGNEKIANY